VYLSIVSAWKIAIKARLGKLPLPDKPSRFVAAMLKRHAFSVLHITIRHALADHDLPSHHSDPFECLLIAQAITEDLYLVSDDAKMAPYPIKVLW
jgi:PIN domain nuclease of toxin-antitoxin system